MRTVNRQPPTIEAESTPGGTMENPSNLRVAHGAPRTVVAACLVPLSLRLSDRIRRARQLRCIGRTSLARAVGVTRNAVAKWEHPAGNSPSVENLIRIAQTTGIAFEWLTTGRGPQRATDDASSLSHESYAQDDSEEQLLGLWRSAPPRVRSSLLVLMSAAVPPLSVPSRQRLKIVDAVAPD